MAQTAAPSGGVRRWVKVGAALTALGTIGGAWFQDTGGVKTNTCLSPKFRQLARAVHLAPGPQREYGFLSCPEGSWVATQAEAADTVDAYLARSSGSAPRKGLDLLSRRLRPEVDEALFADPTPVTEPDLFSHWGGVVWAQRVDAVSVPRDNVVQFTYEVYQSPEKGKLPASVMVRRRTAELSLVHEDGEFKLDAAKDSGRAETEDGSIPLPRVTLVQATRPRRLPYPESDPGIFLDETHGMTVRVICTSQAATGVWVRATDGFVDGAAFPADFDVTSLPECGAQFADRAARKLDH